MNPKLKLIQIYFGIELNIILQYLALIWNQLESC